MTKIKLLIKNKNAFYCSLRKSINFNYATLDAMTLEVSNAISISKTKYECLAIKFNDTQSACKTNWSILKTFVNGKKIPPMLENDKLITDFKVKANLFTDFFNQQYTTVDNPSVVAENISFETEKTFYF